MSLHLPRPSHATVVAYLALATALGGTSYAGIALNENSVGTRHIKHRAVTLAKISPGARESLRGQRGRRGRTGANGANGTAGAAGANGTNGADGATGATGATGSVDTTNFFTKTESDARFLALAGTAANANQLGGILPGGFIQGAGRAQAFHLDLNASTVSAPIFTVTNNLTFHATCNGTATGGSGFVTNTSANDLLLLRDRPGAAMTAETLAPTDESSDFTAAAIDRFQYFFGRGAADVGVLDVWVHNDGTKCRYRALLTLGHAS